MEPRLGAAYGIKPLNLALHASHDRTFRTPPFENLLVSAAPSSRFKEGFYLLRGRVVEGIREPHSPGCRLVPEQFSDFEDDDLLLNTL